jgi:glutamine---fructose-6-phosphate transaminase (isomerizing)
VDPVLFLDDLERKPEVLNQLADILDAGDLFPELPVDPQRVLLLGMGSSNYAAGVAAARMRAQGIDATAELASSDLLPRPDARTMVVAVSASGGSKETLEAAKPFAERTTLVALTNAPTSSLSDLGKIVVPMHAGTERGGVACRSYQHTLVLLLALEHHLLGTLPTLSHLVRNTADACAALLAGRSDWLPPVTEALSGPDGMWSVAPFRRLASAQQSALMLREGPRRQAVACETGDWSHVDVYLTKTLDYRMLLFPGSRYEPELLSWTKERGATIVTVGAEVAGATEVVRYPGDDKDDVRLLTEVLVAELVAQALWSQG